MCFRCITIVNLQELGKLIDESHFSLKDKYNVSIEELDLLTQVKFRVGQGPKWS